MSVRIAAILPSRNEPDTISAVAAAVDTALGRLPFGMDLLVVHADSSDTPATSDQFTATPVQARTVALTGLRRGKGAQILTAARQTELATADVVLIADTDTRAPDPDVYAALLEPVFAGAVLAIADYPRHWDEANLTNHLARPLIAAATGHDVLQPLAGDVALSGDVLRAALVDLTDLPDPLSACVDGYGIDAFLLLTATTLGTPASVRFEQAKQHATSFPHLPSIYHQAVPVLLHLSATRTLGRRFPDPPAYRAADRELAPGRITDMLTVLNQFDSAGGDYDEAPWPLPLASAWQAVRSGVPAVDAAHDLWPCYLARVREWLTWGEHTTTHQRVARLAAAHVNLFAALTVGAS